MSNNTGNRNTGNRNTGNRNTGSWNTGNRNTGYRNTGSWNTGSCNAGNRNTGSCNAGSCNAGNRNTGDLNTGDWNTGSYNSCNHSTGLFNTEEKTIRLFNKDSGLTRDEIDIPYINLKLIEVIDGKLIKRSYKEAWELAWLGLSKEEKRKFLDLPNFDADIFEEITGIRVDNKNCDGKIVEIEGKKYKLQEIE